MELATGADPRIASDRSTVGHVVQSDDVVEGVTTFQSDEGPVCEVT